MHHNGYKLKIVRTVYAAYYTRAVLSRSEQQNKMQKPFYH